MSGKKEEPEELDEAASSESEDDEEDEDYDHVGFYIILNKVKTILTDLQVSGRKIEHSRKRFVGEDGDFRFQPELVPPEETIISAVKMAIEEIPDLDWMLEAEEEENAPEFPLGAFELADDETFRIARGRQQAERRKSTLPTNYKGLVRLVKAIGRRERLLHPVRLLKKRRAHEATAKVGSFRRGSWMEPAATPGDETDRAEAAPETGCSGQETETMKALQKDAAIKRVITRLTSLQVSGMGKSSNTAPSTWSKVRWQFKPQPKVKAGEEELLKESPLSVTGLSKSSSSLKPKKSKPARVGTRVPGGPLGAFKGRRRPSLVVTGPSRSRSTEEGQNMNYDFSLPNLLTPKAYSEGSLSPDSARRLSDESLELETSDPDAIYLRIDDQARREQRDAPGSGNFAVFGIKKENSSQK